MLLDDQGVLRARWRNVDRGIVEGQLLRNALMEAKKIKSELSTINCNEVKTLCCE
jgi:hypothetical protein